MQNKRENMKTMRAYKFRIYPDAKRQNAIDNAISTSQRLYNKLLEKAIEAHKKNPSSKNLAENRQYDATGIVSGLEELRTYSEGAIHA